MKMVKNANGKTITPLLQAGKKTCPMDWCDRETEEIPKWTAQLDEELEKRVQENGTKWKKLNPLFPGMTPAMLNRYKCLKIQKLKRPRPDIESPTPGELPLEALSGIELSNLDMDWFSIEQGIPSI
jgi:hypothetical protein